MVTRQPKPNTAEPGDLVSNSLTWEKVRTWDVGFDYGFFNNRLTGSLITTFVIQTAWWDLPLNFLLH